MRVLWAACSQPGSLFPAVPIVLELQRRGHEVTTLCDPESESTFRGLGCAFSPGLRAGRVPGPDRPLSRATKAAWWSAYTAAMVADTVDALHAASFDVVLADPLETGADFAAEIVGVPHCSYVHWGLDEVGPDVPFRFHLWDGATPVDEAFSDWWNGLRADAGLPPESRSPHEHRWYRTSPYLTLMLGLPELIHPLGQLPATALRIGPTTWEPASHEPLPQWIASLGKEHRVVLASVSTIGPREDVDVLTAIAEAAELLDVDLVVTAAVDHDLPALPGRVRVTRFVPHGALLNRVSVFVNHAGNGSVNRAAASGVPVLMLPTGRDQFQVANGASAAGLGIMLQPDERDVKTISRALSRLLDHPEFTESARALAAQAATYHPEADAADAIEAFVNSRSGGSV